MDTLKSRKPAFFTIMILASIVVGVSAIAGSFILDHVMMVFYFSGGMFFLLQLFGYIGAYTESWKTVYSCAIFMSFMIVVNIFLCFFSFIMAIISVAGIVISIAGFALASELKKRDQQLENPAGLVGDFI